MPQPNLSQIQSWLRWIITDPRGVPEALQTPVPKLENLQAFRIVSENQDRCLRRYQAPEVNCISLIEATPNFKNTDRLSVYAEAYFSRILQSMGEDFPSTKRLVGEDGFEQLVNDYMKEYPSQYSSLAEVGISFSNFLVQHEVSRFLPYIVDLADLEWRIVESFYSSDLPLFDCAKLQNIKEDEWPGVRFKLDSSIRTLRTKWSIDLFWNQNESEICESSRLLRVFRENGVVHVDTVEHAQFETLQMMKTGRTLGEICSNLENAETSASSLDIQKWFNEWIQSGIIRDIEVTK